MASILLVEDDDQLRTMLKSILTNSGYEVWDAPNGSRACHLYDQQSFDLVITDLVMPEKDGLEVIIELRRTNQDVRIIAMSGTGPGSGELYLRVAETRRRSYFVQAFCSPRLSRGRLPGA
jgi:CheY-like chemotaxis protein